MRHPMRFCWAFVFLFGVMACSSQSKSNDSSAVDMASGGSGGGGTIVTRTGSSQGSGSGGTVAKTGGAIGVGGGSGGGSGGGGASGDGSARDSGSSDGGVPPLSLSAGAPLMLKDAWQVQTSTGQPAGAEVSKAGFAATGWYKTSIPACVSGVLAQAGVYPDPFVDLNLLSWPNNPKGPAGGNPFAVGWWFRTEFDLPADLAERTITLHLEGITYRADVWLNGQRIADSTQVLGVMRRYALDVGKAAKPGARNALALLIQGQGSQDLGHTWVDWAPMPPDNMQGLWRDVFITVSGSLRMLDPFVRTKLATDLNSADLTVSMDLKNTGSQMVNGTVTATLDGIESTMPVSVAGGATQKVILNPADYPGLRLTKPRVWWPVGFGKPELYDMRVSVKVGDSVSDAKTIRFGVREAASELTTDGYRRYLVNHRPILIRGAGWARNLFFMETPKREEQEMRLVLDMGLNAVRFEGKLGSEHLLDLADERGLLVIAGFCCCDWWEHWSEWSSATKTLVVDSFRDQLLLLRNRPSILTFWYASDKMPTAEIENKYLKVMEETGWPNATGATASRLTTVVGPSGVKMEGPYDYEPPMYWYGDRDGGAFGFATEIGTGKTIPSVDGMRKMLGEKHLWPRDEAWTLHTQGGDYTPFDYFETAMKARYGVATDLNDYVRKAQLIAYDGERAMFEAYGRNKYKSTGVIKWMLNNAWPSTAWHLYDYYLEAGSGYYGTKKSLEPIHVQYSFDDKSIAVVNSTLDKATGLTVRASVVDIAGAEKWSKSTVVDVPADGVVRAFTIPDIAGISKTYFVSLAIADAGGKTVGRNFYWLSTVKDELDVNARKWYITPTKVHGDFTALASLPQVTLGVESAIEHDGDDDRALVTITNPGSSVAFFVRLRMLKGAGGAEILPSIWEDNYVSLLPGEARTLTARWRPEDAGGAIATVSVDGWNVPGK